MIVKIYLTLKLNQKNKFIKIYIIDILTYKIKNTFSAILS